MDQPFHEKEIVIYPNGGKSYFYDLGKIAIIIDEDVCKCNDKTDYFPYSLITDKQNEYMYQYDKVYRFLMEDIHRIEKSIFQSDTVSDIDFNLHVRNREDVADVSPLEYLFEQNFTNVYGMDALSYLHKEYGIVDDEGNNYFLDYYLQKDQGGIAVEENGISYHHPQIIGIERYRKQLQKQNTCTKWNIKLYRFSTEDCQFELKIEDDIKRFFGNDLSAYRMNQLVVNRQIVLYEHQETTLQDIQKVREEGCKTFLVVFPTAAGKSKIAEEDMKQYAKLHSDFKALILVPNHDLVLDWNSRIQNSLKQYENQIMVSTYAYMIRHYLEFSNEHFTYIVVDEAHHAVAPVIKRVIQYFTPQFMIGLTATDQRPDKQKLETVFGNYQVQLTLPEAMEKGIVAQANVYRIETNIDLSKVRFNGKDYVNADLEKSIRVTSRNELIVNVISQYFCGDSMSQRQGIIFCVNVKHTIEMERLLNKAGISAKAYTGSSKNTNQIMADFKSKKIRFLCACNMISEGWDYPELGILVMARPTLSKVLYLQQIGRGLRKTSSKNNVFIIDVVDEYGAMVKPCSMHGIFQNMMYVPFGNIIQRDYHVGDMIEIDGLKERIERIVEIDISNFEDKYGSYYSQEQIAREYFVSTGTITSWIRKGKITPTVQFPFGNKKIYLFSPEDVEKYRDELQIPLHSDETLKDDFFQFLAERDYSLSYKIVFLTCFMKRMNMIGEASIEDILTDYIQFYLNRIAQQLPVDKSSCPYNEKTLKDRKLIKNSMLTNPFEKFERKRFMYYAKDLGMIALHPVLFSQLTTDDIQSILIQMQEDEVNYYGKIE